MIVEDQGCNNVLEILSDIPPAKGGHIVFTGSNSRVVIGPGCKASKVKFIIGEDSEVSIGSNCKIAATEIMIKHNGHVHIGNNVSFTWHAKIYLHEPSNFRLGSRSLIASNTLFTTSDMHSIIDLASGARINPPDDIDIGEHVWIGAHATVLRGVSIGNDSVVGMSSLVTRSIPAHCVAAGIPARVIRQGVTWKFERLP
jgi:acetyltransferase-like isoleucine patch superfamily enzyme